MTRTPVRYVNRYGIEIAADLYQRKGLDEATTHPAVVIGPPHGGVKEQGPGVYAQELARRGFVALRTSAPGSITSARCRTSTASRSASSAAAAAAGSP